MAEFDFSKLKADPNQIALMASTAAAIVIRVLDARSKKNALADHDAQAARQALEAELRDRIQDLESAASELREEIKQLRAEVALWQQKYYEALLPGRRREPK